MERRHPGVSVDDMRRHLLEADADRFRLRRALAHRAGRPQRIRRATGAMAAALAIAAVGGVAWQMCTRPARAEAAQVRPAHLQVATVAVHPTLIVQSTTNAAASTAPARRRRAPLRAGVRSAHAPRAIEARAPRPLSPGEFGRTPPRPAAAGVVSEQGD